MRLPFFYGWIIIAVTFVTMAIASTRAPRFSLFFPRSSTSSDGSAASRRARSRSAFWYPPPRAPDRPHDGSLRPRAVMELGVGLMAGGLLLAPLTTQPWLFI